MNISILRVIHFQPSLQNKFISNMIVYPNAKINLGLNIVSRRSDGFHDISTVFYPVANICDVLEVLPIEGQYEPLLFSQSGLAVDCDLQKNLCVKAFDILASRFKLPPLKVHLHKQIPMGAGLGGGSSDGAFMLKAINQIIGSPLNSAQLCELALLLGSDCPFFIYNTPSVGRGRGELLTSIQLDLKKYFLMLVNPGIHVSTASAYSGSSPKAWSVSIDELISYEVDSWKNQLHNDFEPTVFAQHPEIEAIKSKMYNLGAVYASMSGSGSTVYGLCRSNDINTKCFDNYFCRIVAL